MSKPVLKVDTRRLKRFTAALADVPTFRLGLVGDKAAEAHSDSADAKTVAQIGAEHELGIGVPRRSWLLDWRKDRASHIEKVYAQAFERWGADVSSELTPWLELATRVAVEDIRERIRDGIDPPLTEATKRAKETSSGTKDTPLIRTGQFVSSITYDKEG